MLKLGVFASIFFFIAGAYADDECIKVRGSIDMGSGTTKFVVAQVNTCKKPPEIVGKELYSKNLKYSLQSKIVLSNKPEYENIGRFEEGTVKKFGEELNAVLKDPELLKHPPVDWACGATAAIRNTGTADEKRKFLDNLQKFTGLKCRILKQTDEGEFGLAGVQNSKTNPCKQTDKSELAFDIGGGSIQMTFKEKPSDSTPRVGRYTYGSESFRNEIRADIKSETNDTSDTLSPYPIGKNRLRKYINLSLAKAPSAWAMAPKPDFQKYCVVGIGGVHNFAIQESLTDLGLREALKRQVDPTCAGLKSETQASLNSYSYNELVCLTNYLIDKTDDQLKKIFPKTNVDYLSTNVSNMVLVLGFMEYMGFNGANANQRLYTHQVNMNNQLLLEEKDDFPDWVRRPNSNKKIKTKTGR